MFARDDARPRLFRSEATRSRPSAASGASGAEAPAELVTSSSCRQQPEGRGSDAERQTTEATPERERALAKTQARETAREEGRAEVTKGTARVPRVKGVHPNSMAARKLGASSWLGGGQRPAHPHRPRQRPSPRRRPRSRRPGHPRRRTGSTPDRHHAEARPSRLLPAPRPRHRTADCRQARPETQEGDPIRVARTDIRDRSAPQTRCQSKAWKDSYVFTRSAPSPDGTRLAPARVPGRPLVRAMLTHLGVYRLHVRQLATLRPRRTQSADGRTKPAALMSAGAARYDH